MIQSLLWIRCAVNSITNVHMSLLWIRCAVTCMTVSFMFARVSCGSGVLVSLHISNTGYSTPDPQDTLANISDTCHWLTAHLIHKRLANINDTVHSTTDPQETLANISDTVHSTPDPQETLKSLVDWVCCDLYH
jgi:hypothetical protein